MHGGSISFGRAGLNGLRGRFGFLLALWLSLATAVICAVVPAGLPSTRSVGSAFDPSTTIVALRSRPPIEAKAAILRIGDGDRDGTGIGGGAAALPAFPPVPITSGVAIRPAAAMAPTVVAPIFRAIGIAFYARPPPTA